MIYIWNSWKKNVKKGFYSLVARLNRTMLYRIWRKGKKHRLQVVMKRYSEAILSRIVQLGWPWAANRYINYMLGRLAPETCFLCVNNWPTNPFPWTDCHVSVCLSFDCDTPEDSLALEPLLRVLEKHRLRANFALTGALVEENPTAYRRLVEAGHEILNHGYRPHMVKSPDGGYYSNLFYENLSWDQIEDEIRRNQDCLETMLGLCPLGFRTPHFATFQLPNQVDRLHRILAQQGFRYSSSMLMWYAKQRGYFRKSPVIELPISSYVGPPLSVFDSWSLVVQQSRRGRSIGLFEHWKRALDVALSGQWPIFLNTYFDPSHVVELNQFIDALEYLAMRKNQVWVDTYTEIVRVMDSVAGL